ncbi:hypothetical protein ACFQ68_21830 [Amycolatopsis japonica]|uniref:hypothetical protein n=1 Tax=Amycolatopsis japonica TaxID=208439 RepID=UPI00366E4A19
MSHRDNLARSASSQRCGPSGRSQTPAGSGSTIVVRPVRWASITAGLSHSGAGKRRPSRAGSLPGPQATQPLPSKGGRKHWPDALASTTPAG